MVYDLAMPFDLNSFFNNVTYSFSRPFYESRGYYAVEKDGKLFLVLNILGINENDLDVSVENDPDNVGWQILIVKGTTHNEILDKDFSLTWKRSTRKPISEIAKNVKDGLLTLEITFVEPVKPSVKIFDK